MSQLNKKRKGHQGPKCLLAFHALRGQNQCRREGVWNDRDAIQDEQDNQPGHRHGKFSFLLLSGAERCATRNAAKPSCAPVSAPPSGAITGN